MSKTSTTGPNQINTDVLRTRAAWKELGYVGVVSATSARLRVLLLTRNKLQKMFPIFDWAAVIRVGTKYRNEKSGFDIYGGRRQ